MIKLIKRWITSPSHLESELLALRSCNVETELPRLVVEDTHAYIDKPKGNLYPTIDFVIEDYYASILKYARTITVSSCNVADVYQDGCSSRRAIARGIQFWHDDGRQYIYWAWLHPDHNKKIFAADLFDALARQGLDRRTLDNFRIDYRAGRIYQHHLPLK